MAARSIVYKGSWPGKWSDLLSRFCARHDLHVQTADEPDQVHAFVNRAFPSCLVLEGASDTDEALALCSELKKDPFTAVVPIVVLALADQTDLISDWLAAGADEVVSETHSEREQDLRLELVIRRAQRDVAVHPTTRLPGTVQIERNIGERLSDKEEFAVCYADLDNFKEFNDRYGYNHGDHVILLLSRILRDVVRGLASDGFVGHIGGDDFIFIVNMKYLGRMLRRNHLPVRRTHPVSVYSGGPSRWLFSGQGPPGQHKASPVDDAFDRRRHEPDTTVYAHSPGE